MREILAAWLHGPPNPTVQAELVRDVVALLYQVPPQIARKGHVEIELPDMHGKILIRERQANLTIDRGQIEPGTGPMPQPSQWARPL